MTFQGYASRRLDNLALQPYQLQAMKAYNSQKDAIVVQATGAGKSICFYLPVAMPPKNRQVLAVVPTNALGHDHVHRLRAYKVTSVFINSSSSQRD